MLSYIYLLGMYRIAPSRIPAFCELPLQKLPASRVARYASAGAVFGVALYSFHLRTSFLPAIACWYSGESTYASVSNSAGGDADRENSVQVGPPRQGLAIALPRGEKSSLDSPEGE